MASVKVKLNVNCGCRFKATSLEEAKNHCEKTGHTITILGEVRSDTKKKQRHNDVHEPA